MISQVMTLQRPNPRAKADAAAVAAVDVARAALVDDVDAADVGEHLGHVVEGERLVTHLFACTAPGTSAGAGRSPSPAPSRQKRVTVDEVVLVPGEDAIVAPAWVPYRERIQPGDLSPGDLLPVEEDDPRLVPTYSFGDDPLDTDDKAQVRAVAQDLGLGRVRTLSPRAATSPPSAGTTVTAARGRRSPRPRRSPATRAASWCGSTGPSAGAVRRVRQRQRQRRRRVVSFDHGCGAHSEVKLAKKHEPLPCPTPCSTP